MPTILPGPSTVRPIRRPAAYAANHQPTHPSDTTNQHPKRLDQPTGPRQLAMGRRLSGPTPITGTTGLYVYVEDAIVATTSIKSVIAYIAITGYRRSVAEGDVPSNGLGQPDEEG